MVTRIKYYYIDNYEKITPFITGILYFMEQSAKLYDNTQRGMGL